jgi:DNA-binding PadR family transcriptional regulator
MSNASRRNPLALAVLMSLRKQPMHPYEVASTLRGRAEHDSVRLNYGSLYSVVESLERRGLIRTRATTRQGRRPQRTLYEITDAGRIEMEDWLRELLRTPVKEYPQVIAALSFLPAVEPGEAVRLLRDRAQRLQMWLAQAHATHELVEQQGLPRLFWIEEELRTIFLKAELAYVQKLADDIDGEVLDGLAEWRQFHLQPQRDVAASGQPRPLRAPGNRCVT